MSVSKRITGLAAAFSIMFSSVLVPAKAETTQLVNYALECQVASCSSGDKSPAANAADGDYSTEWATWTSTRRGTVEFSLPEATMLNKVTVTNGTSTSRNLTLALEVSADGYDYTVVQKDISLQAGKEVDIFFDNTLCEFVRVKVTDVAVVNNTYYGFSIAEIGLYFDDSESDKTFLSKSVQSAQNMVERFRTFNPEEVSVPDDAYEMLEKAAREGKMLLEDKTASQYLVNNKVSQIDSAIEKFIGMVKYSDSVFKDILERKKARQIDVNATYDDADNVWTTMNKSAGAEGLWSLSDAAVAGTNADFLTAWGSNFVALSKAYVGGESNKGNKSLLNDIEYAFNWLYENKYNENTKQYGNWWQWAIGGPKRYVDTMINLQDELSDEIIVKMCNAIEFHLSDFWTDSGANRTDKANIAICIAALKKDGQLLYKAQQCVLGDLVYIEDGGTGHYRDGSYLYHGGLSYNGNYGKELLKSVAGIIIMTTGTPFQVDDYYIDALKDVSEKGYDPLVYKGHFTYAARGRMIYGEDCAREVSSIIDSVADCLEEPKKTLVKSLSMKMGLKGSNEDVSTDSDRNMHIRYAAMDRTAHLNDEFGFYLSTYSPRTILFEAINGADMLGWYQSAGQFYLETEDKSYYDDGYMETIDWYRLPGTTVDTVTRTNKRWDGETKNPYEFVGGASIDAFGTEAMEFGLPNTDLYGKKSWFMFDDEIVFLGSDITEKSGNKVESIVDNRKIKNENENKLVVNGEEKSTELGKTKQFIPKADPMGEGEDVLRGEEIEKGYNEKINNVKWVYLENNFQENIGNGYIFPKGTALNVKREERVGCRAVNTYGGSEDEVSRNWVTMWIDHGINPQNSSYEWILLPQKTQEEIEKYAEDSQISIIENSSEVHAVRENNLNILGVNSYAYEGSTIEGITVDKPASYMVRETENYYEFSVSEPIRSQTAKIHIEAEFDADTVLSKDDRIENISFDNGVVSFDVDVSAGDGNDSRIVFGKSGIFTNASKEMLANSYLQIGNTTALAGGKTHTITSPIVLEGTAYVPLRFVSEALGGRVSWDGKTQRVQIITDSHTAVLTIGSDILRLDRENVKINAAPINLRGTTMLPIRALADALAVEINWDEEQKIVEIVSEGRRSCLTDAAKVFGKLK